MQAGTLNTLYKNCIAVWARCFHRPHKGRVFKSVPTPRWSTADAEIKGPLVGTQGYQRFPISKPVVGHSVALRAVSVYMTSTYLVSAFPAHSTSFHPNFFNPQRLNVHWIVNQNLYFVPLWYDPSQLTGRKHQVWIQCFPQPLPNADDSLLMTWAQFGLLRCIVLHEWFIVSPVLLWC